MNEVKQLSSETEINSLLLPLAGRQLIVPAVTVAEMIPYQEPQKENQDLPAWYLGEIVWRHSRVPCVSYELMCGDDVPSGNASCRIAVLNNSGVSERLPFLAVLTQGIPRLSRVGAEEIHEVADAELKTFDFMHVKHAGEELVIPDVASIQQAVLDMGIAV